MFRKALKSFAIYTEVIERAGRSWRSFESFLKSSVTSVVVFCRFSGDYN
jgi:hypothetical protein